MKKFNCILLVLCSLMLLVSGCTENNSNSAESISPIDSITPTVTPTEPPTSSQIPKFLFEDENCGYYADENVRDIIKISKKDQNDSLVVLSYKSLVQSDGNRIVNLRIVNDLIFFRLGFDVYRYDLKTQGLSEVYGDARKFQSVGNDMYFCGRECTIYKMNFYDTESTAILQAENKSDNKYEWTDIYKNFIFIEDVMYYYKRNPDGLFRYENGVSTLIDDK